MSDRITKFTEPMRILYFYCFWFLLFIQLQWNFYFVFYVSSGFVRVRTWGLIVSIGILESSFSQQILIYPTCKSKKKTKNKTWSCTGKKPLYLFHHNSTHTLNKARCEQTEDGPGRSHTDRWLTSAGGGEIGEMGESEGEEPRDTEAQKESDDRVMWRPHTIENDGVKSLVRFLMADWHTARQMTGSLLFLVWFRVYFLFAECFTLSTIQWNSHISNRIFDCLISLIHIFM